MGLFGNKTKDTNYPRFTWANRPTKALVGSIIDITDIGSSNELFTWNGTRWAPSNGSVLVSQSNVKVDYTGSTGAVVMATITIPGGLMSANGILEVLTSWQYTNSANSKTIAIRFSGTGGTAFFSRAETTTASHQVNLLIRNANSISSQIGMNGGATGSFGTSTGAIATSSVNTGSDTTISISGNLALSSETISLYSYRVNYRE